MQLNTDYDKVLSLLVGVAMGYVLGLTMAAIVEQSPQLGGLF